MIDGPLYKAVVCLDRNANSLCDPDEPSATTDAQGNASLDVPTAEVGLHPIVAMVGTDAIDADTGAIPTAYILKAPPDATGLISPLTSMIQSQRESTGTSTAEAAASIQALLGLDSSPLANFTQDKTPSAQLAATLARLIVVTAQTLQNNTQGALGVDGKPLSSAQISNVIHRQLLQQLPTLATAVQDDPELSDASKSIPDKQSAMQAAAKQLASASDLNSTNIGLAAASQESDNTPEPGTPTDTSSLRWFWFGNASNYYLRVFTATTAQNTPDAQGKRYFTEYRKELDEGNARPWLRPDIYWTGAEWFDCPISYVNEITHSTTTGVSESLYCKSLRTTAKQSTRDISGLSMRTIVKEIRSSPLMDSSEGSFADWGADPALIPATAKWPQGSTLTYRNVRDMGEADYYSRDNEALIPYSSQPSPYWRSASLAEFTAWNAGDFAPGVSTTQLNEKNALILVNSRRYLRPDGSIDYKRYMVGFETGGAQRARFYECDGEASVCKTIMESNYSISVQGDAKVLRFKNEPVQLNNNYFPNYHIFVERKGITYAGSRDKAATSFQQRLNKTATDALLSTLGVN